MISQDAGQKSTNSRSAPHNLDAEKSVLGAMTLSLDAVATAAQTLRPEVFFLPEHGEIFKAILALFEDNILSEPVTLVEELNRQGVLDKVGGAEKITEISSYVATVAHLEHHIDILKEKYTLRNLIQTATQIVSESYEPSTQIKELLDRAEKKIFEIAQEKQERDFVHIRKLIKSSIEKAEELYNLRDKLTGIPSGIQWLDKSTCGLQPSDLIVLAARPSMGKTAFALNIAEHAAVVNKVPVGIFSLEMSKEQVVFRLLCSNARVSGEALRAGKASKENMTKLANAAARLAESPIYIDDTPGLSVMELKGKARRLQAKTGCQMLMIDYLQLMTSGMGRNEGRQQEISDISRSIKELARELNVPIIILSQLNRSVESRADHRPMLSDLRESGAIEQDADVVMMLTRKEYYNKEDEPGLADLILAKQRNGPVGDTKLTFLKEFARFENPVFNTEDLMEVEEPGDVFE